MGTVDKIKNKVDEAKAKTKEVVADLTDDSDMKGEAKTDERKSDLKQAGEKVKDALPGN